MERISRATLVRAGAAGLVATALTATSASASPGGRFAGKVVLVTGATSGIGEATARAFAREGARVFFCGRRDQLGRQVASSIRSAGGEATFRQADVRVEPEVRDLVEACVRKYGRLDIAVNNAGIESPRAVRLHEQSLVDRKLSGGPTWPGFSWE
jgi:NAD(P)-dependent dehydrogenase (short-subunit alcohol dehydrogenase family)